MPDVWIKSIEEASSFAFWGRRDAVAPAASLRWPLSGIEMMIACSELSVEIEARLTDHAPWICAFADGALFARFPVMEGRHWYPILRGMDASIPHRIALCNDTQPMEMSKMGMRFLSLQSDGRLLPPEEPKYHFEFVGDSLTTGEGCAGPVDANEWKTIWMSPANGYAQMVCKEMGARPSLISQSGWGVYSSWDNNTQCVLPRIYDQLCGVIEAGQIPYHFSPQMDVVIINLGTNDISALKNLPLEQQQERAQAITQAAAAFLRQIRKHNPSAYLLWVYGMCGQEWMMCFQKSVEMTRAAGDEKIGFCALPPCQEKDIGSRFHPGPNNHRQAAHAICEHLKCIQT